MDLRYVIMNVLRTSETSATTLYIPFHCHPHLRVMSE